MTATSSADAVVIGAGFSGLYMMYRLQDHLGLDVRAFEAGDNVGGTWNWTHYPGARCDSESFVYCYSFCKELLQEWQKDPQYESLCIHCNKCMPTIYTGTRCVLVNDREF